MVTPASAQDRGGAVVLVLKARRRGRRLRHAWAGNIYEGPWTRWAHSALGLEVEIVRRPDLAAFQVLPRRRVIERTLAWITRRRRGARDYERLPAHHAATVQWAAIFQMTRRLARTTSTRPCRRQKRTTALMTAMYKYSGRPTMR